MKQKKIFLFAAPVVVIIAVLILFNPFGSGKNLMPQKSLALIDETDSITFWVTGDAMMHLPQYTSAKNPETGIAEFDSCYTYIRPIIKSADVRLVNFETTLAGAPYSGYPKFSAPKEYADALVRAGFNFFVFANNHACDRGGSGIEGNLDFADSVKMWHTGVFRNQAERTAKYPFILQTKNWKIAILNCTYGTNGIKAPEPYIVNDIDTIQMSEDFKKAKAQNVDAIIVSIHWGEEYQPKPNSSQKAIADFLWRNGADVIIGSHPHVVQPMELVTPIGSMNEKLVMWSMGNFISNQKDHPTDAGLLVGFTLKKTRYGKPEISNVRYIPFYRYKNDIRPGYFLMPGIMTEKNLDKYIPNKEDQEDFASVMADTREKMNAIDKFTEVER